MQLLRHAQHFEYRSQGGLDRHGRMDVWTDDQGTRAVLVLRDVPLADAPRALRMLSEQWLPYLLPAALDVLVLVIHDPEDGSKARARVFPLNAA
ncbi:MULTISPECIES: hypothetical protein [Deinococcus]|uniref:Uncharacterized protein n=1 Tax=Deinococcus rufus TaxID=2136097 RepID=A0ABV7Z645_9DEIO|nr:hypothetical protein [Deinococcus sp. AB2017081]WQE96180.1 hypothetical protein U2P90_04600 [Deinococcus sp. AB2017081]